MGSMAAPPSMANPPDVGGPVGGGPNVSPAPPQPPPPGASEAISKVTQLNNILKDLKDTYPATVEVINRFMLLMPLLQMKIIQSMPPTEATAPPV